MKQLHPDRHTLKDTSEQERVSALATKVTNGFSVLKDDHQRALHLLDLSGAPMEDTVSVGNLFLLLENKFVCVNKHMLTFTFASLSSHGLIGRLGWSGFSISNNGITRGGG